MSADFEGTPRALASIGMMARIGVIRWGGLAAIAVLALACGASDSGASGETGSDQAIIVGGGDKLVAAVKDDSVEVYKTRDGATLPFAPSEMKGKALLIHPIPGKTETGVYARITAVVERDETLLLSTEPMGLDEMEDIEGPNVLALYVDKSLPTASSDSSSAHGPRLFPASLSSGLHPLTWGGVLSGELGMGGYIPFTDHSGVASSFTVSQESGSVSLVPEAHASWTKTDGYSFGFNVDFTAESVLHLTGTLAGIVTPDSSLTFESPTFSTPALVAAIPIGPVPVPTSFRVTAKVVCGFSDSVTVDGKVHVTLHLGAKGSALVQPAVDVDPADWFKTGDVPWEVTGDLSVEPEETTVTTSAKFFCTVPRLALEENFAGTGGLFLALVPNVTIDTDGTLDRSVALQAGAQIEVFGKSVSKMVTMFSWKPGG